MTISHYLEWTWRMVSEDEHALEYPPDLRIEVAFDGAWECFDADGNVVDPWRSEEDLTSPRCLICGRSRRSGLCPSCD